MTSKRRFREALREAREIEINARSIIAEKLRLNDELRAERDAVASQSAINEATIGRQSEQLRLALATVAQQDRDATMAAREHKRVLVWLNRTPCVCISNPADGSVLAVCARCSGLNGEPV